MSRCFMRVLAPIFCLLGIGFWAQLHQLHAQDQPPADTTALIDLEMLPQDSQAVAAVFPQQVIADPQMKLMPIEIASAWMIENIGIDILDIQSVTASVGTPGPNGVEYGFLVKLTKDFNARLLNRRLLAGPAEVIGGYQAIPLANLDNTYLHRIDAKTYIVATPDHLVKMMAKNGSEGPLANLISTRNSKSPSPIVAAMIMEPVREQWLQGLAEMPPDVPGPIRELAAIPNLLRGVHLEQGIMLGESFRLTMIGNSDSDADEMAKILEDAMMFGKNLAAMQAMQEVEGTGPIPEATRAYIRRLADEITAMLKPTQSGNELVIELDNQGGIATSGVLVGLLLPAVQAAREAARRMTSQNNLKQIILAFHNYESTYVQFPLPISRDEDGKPLLSWRVAILPFIEQNELYNQFHLDEPWDSEHNIQLLDKMPITYADPSLALPPGMTIYQVPVGDKLLFRTEGKTRFADITDGTSYTIALFEANANAAVPWTKPTDAEITEENPLANMAKHRQGGFNAALADGSVRFFSETIDPELFWKLLTRSGGEVVNF